MSLYAIALFVHIVGALEFFVALGLEWISLRQLRRATTTAQMQEWFPVANRAGRIGMPSMIVLFVCGFSMMATVWGLVALISVSLAAIGVLIVVTTAFSRPRMAAIGQAVTIEEGVVTPTLCALVHHPTL